MKLLKLEFFKCRRRKIALVCAAVLAAELLWFAIDLPRQDAEDLAQGWMLLFYNLALIDAIFLPISVAVIASRNCELEHKGAALKLLETMVTPGRLYITKLTWGALVLAALLSVRSAAFAAMGAAAHFSGDIPWGKFALFTVISWAVSMMVYALQQGLSLRFANQAPGGTTACCPWPGWIGTRTPGSPSFSGAGRSLWMWCCCFSLGRCFLSWAGRCSSGRRCEGCCCAV